VAELWEESPPEQPDPLAALVGLGPAAVSQHLKILKDTSLVTAQRRGRLVVYQRTAAAGALLEAIRSHEQAG
jgi:DNA-binding transcriptional ArsR family regulator